MRKPRVNKQGFSNPRPGKRIPILQIDKQNNLIQEFSCCREAAIILGINEKAINNVLKNRTKTSGGFFWKYKL